MVDTEMTVALTMVVMVAGGEVLQDARYVSKEAEINIHKYEKRFTF